MGEEFFVVKVMERERIWGFGGIVVVVDVWDEWRVELEVEIVWRGVVGVVVIDVLKVVCDEGRMWYEVWREGVGEWREDARGEDVWWWNRWFREIERGEDFVGDRMIVGER